MEGTLGAPERKKIGFVVHSSTSGNLVIASSLPLKGVFVEVLGRDPSGQPVMILCRILETTTFNPHIDLSTAARYLGTENHVIENLSTSNSYHSKAQVVGTSKKAIRGGLVIAPPGAEVFEPDPFLVSEVLECGPDGPVLGHVSGEPSALVHLTREMWQGRHLAVLGQTGSGKTFLVSKIVSALSEMRLATPLIIDQNGEYRGWLRLASPMTNTPEDLLVTGTVVQRFLDELGVTSYGRRGVRRFGRGRQVRLGSLDESEYNQTDVENTWRPPDSELADLDPTEREETAWLLRGQGLHPKKSIDLSRCTIVDLSTVPTLRLRQFLTKLFLEQLWAYQRSNPSHKMFLVLEEAHTMAPSVHSSLAKGLVETLAREGRKFGITLCLVTQRPRWVDQTVLAQCSTAFVFRTSHGGDIEYISGALATTDPVLTGRLSSLTVGEALLTSISLPVPVPVVID